PAPAAGVGGALRNRRANEGEGRMSGTSRNTLISLAGNLLAMLLGMGVVVCVGARYGAGPRMDAFWAANTLPNIIGQVYLSLSLLLLSPVFIARRTQAGEAAAWEVGNTFMTGAMTAATAISGLMFAG